jgi:hypothetical protein
MARSSAITINLDQAITVEHGMFIASSKYLETFKLLCDVCQMIRCL